MNFKDYADRHGDDIAFELEEELGREPTEDEVNQEIADRIESALDDIGDQKHEQRRDEG